MRRVTRSGHHQTSPHTAVFQEELSLRQNVTCRPHNMRINCMCISQIKYILLIKYILCLMHWGLSKMDNIFKWILPASIGSDDGFTCRTGDKPSPKPLMTKFYNTIQHHKASMSKSKPVVTPIIKCGMKLLFHSQTSMVQPLEFGNGQIFSSHTL